MKAVWNGVTIAGSDDTMLVEDNHYFPLDSVDPQVLRRSAMRSPCRWKGLASYDPLEANGERNSNAAWIYRHRYPWIRKIKNRVAFWNGVDVRPG